MNTLLIKNVFLEGKITDILVEGNKIARSSALENSPALPLMPGKHSNATDIWRQWFPFTTLIPILP